LNHFTVPLGMSRVSFLLALHVVDAQGIQAQVVPMPWSSQRVRHPVRR
jgi:hypothetical protein